MRCETWEQDSPAKAVEPYELPTGPNENCVNFAVEATPTDDAASVTSSVREPASTPQTSVIVTAATKKRAAHSTLSGSFGKKPRLSIKRAVFLNKKQVVIGNRSGADRIHSVGQHSLPHGGMHKVSSPLQMAEVWLFFPSLVQLFQYTQEIGKEILKEWQRGPFQITESVDGCENLKNGNIFN